jgi:hypothetical protein
MPQTSQSECNFSSALPSKYVKANNGGYAMDSPLVFEEKELARIGVVCEKCNAEAIFDLSQAQSPAASPSCPNCSDGKFLESFKPASGRSYNPVTFYQSAAIISKQSSIRFYFKHN